MSKRGSRIRSARLTPADPAPDNLNKAYLDVRESLRTIVDFGGDPSIHKLAIGLYEFVTEMARKVESNEAQILANEKETRKDLRFHESSIGLMKTTLDRQDEAITNLTTVATLLDGAALDVS